MRELSLFSGAGGGLLGTHLLGWRPIGYVEFDDYCQRVIRARIDDGILPDAPIFGDIRAFNGEGYARRYRGVADVITAGFPCQPFSAAGKRKGATDDRNMWPATLSCIQIVRPKYVLLENVPGLLSARSPACVCGWPNRRGRMHWDTVEQQGRSILRGDNDWYGSEGQGSLSTNQGTIRGNNKAVQTQDEAVGKRLEMAYWWGRSTHLPGDDSALSIPEIPAGANSAEDEETVCGDGNASEWDEEMDRCLEGEGESSEERDAQTESDGARCPRCGRWLVSTDAKSIRYLGTILGDLAESGYDCRWRVLSAAEVGAPHRRKRLWIVAYRESERSPGGRLSVRSRGSQQAANDAEWMGESLPNAEVQGLASGYARSCGSAQSAGIFCRSERCGSEVAYADEARLSQSPRRPLGSIREPEKQLEGCAIGGRSATGEQRSWWQVEPDVGRVADELAPELDKPGTFEKGLLR